MRHVVTGKTVTNKKQVKNPQRKKKKTNKKHEWLKGAITNPFEDSVKIAKLVSTEDVK
jgi:hypothetical protein